jgi:hypothetical protein
LRLVADGLGIDLEAVKREYQQLPVDYAGETAAPKSGKGGKAKHAAPAQEAA